MKAQDTSTKSQVKQSRNQVLALYIIFITALVATYAIVTALKVL